MRAATILCMNDVHHEMRGWLSEVLRRSGLSPYALAKKAGVSTTTITRGLDPNAKHTLSSTTVAKIRAVAGDHAHAGPAAPIGFAESGADELSPVAAGTSGDPRVDDAVRYLVAGDQGLVPWKLNTRALEVAGYLPGDIAIVDLNAQAVDGDAVVAQHYVGSNAQTIFRLYQKPYLVAAATDRAIRRPLAVDDMAVSIRGVVVASFRPRRGHLAIV